MIIIMKQGTTHEHVDELSRHIERWNVKANPIYGEGTIVIGLVGDTGAVDKDALMLDPQVENIIKVQEPFKLANRKFHPDNSVVEIAPGVAVGGKKLVVMAGPCSVESEEQIVGIATAVKASGVRALTCICPDRATARLIENKVSGTRAYEGSSGYTDLADASQSAVLMYLPVKAEKTERLESDLRNALFETRRVLEPEGRIVVIAALHHAESTLRKTQGVRVLGRYPLTLSGQKSAIWVMETTPANEDA